MYLVTLLIACHLSALVWLNSKQTPVWHEPAQLAAGLSWWSFGRNDMIGVNPPLVRSVAAFPVFLLKSPVLDEKEFSRPPNGRDEHARSDKFLRDNGDHLREYFTLARRACIPFSLLGAFSVGDGQVRFSEIMPV